MNRVIIARLIGVSGIWLEEDKLHSESKWMIFIIYCMCKYIYIYIYLFINLYLSLFQHVSFPSGYTRALRTTRQEDSLKGGTIKLDLRSCIWVNYNLSPTKIHNILSSLHNVRGFVASISSHQHRFRLLFKSIVGAWHVVFSNLARDFGAFSDSNLRNAPRAYHGFIVQFLIGPTW